jgi:Uma2 family endonuclease
VFTVDEYLERERAATERHEYLDSHILAMAGTGPEHGDISLNLAGLFYLQLKGTSCRARTKDTKVRSGPTPLPGHGSRGLFSYPDVVIVCGEPEYHDAHQDVVVNPAVIVEVLSPTTEAFDRGAKFTRYQTWNPTLTDYVLVSQDQPKVEHYRRQADGGWSYHRHAGLGTAFTIPSIRCTLTLADVYDRVTLSQS